MMQIPNYVNPYIQQPLTQQYVTPAPSYNAVKIDVHNPSVNTPGVGQSVVNVPQYVAPQAAPAPQYATPTMPYYTYPQAQLYDYPQAPQQPYYLPVQTICPPCQPSAAPVPPEVTAQVPAPQVTAAPAPAVQTEIPAPQTVVPVAQTVVPQPVINQQNINAPQPAPVAEAPKAPETPAKVEVVPPAAVEPQVDLNGFVAKLTNPDYDVQALAMEDMANMVKTDPQKATELLDTKIMDALNTIINTDSTKLAGPTPEQLAAREKLFTNQKMTDDEKALASSITPLEQAERNKSYAMFTAAIMQKLYADEVSKLTNTTVPITELPGAVTIVEQLKNNPNPMVRTSALEALSYIQNPAYKKDLETLFTIAKNDQDKGVQEAAAMALEKLNQMPA